MTMNSNRSSAGLWATMIIAVVFGLVFAFYLYEAISQAISLAQYVAVQNPVLKRVGHALLSFPWLVIGAYVVLPIVTFVLAVVIGRRRTVPIRVGIFVLALAALSAASLTLESIASAATRIN
ncbi:MAG: hypothetical protein JWM49_276 [Microbacteriaceae bacterium]|jgi:hypothetical protein|nr:hypothetical protein [Microbacteriaceae bacterium]